MRKKKDLPLIILKSLEPFVKLKGDKFDVIDPKEKLLTVVDKDPDSTFHFTIEQYKKENGRFTFLMDKSPRNENDNGIIRTWVDINDLNGQFESWIKLLKQYESVTSFYDDPIIKTYKEEFFTEFEIIDEDRETNPFDTKRVLLLDNYLESVDKKLKELSDEKNENDIKDIQADIVILRENLTTKSKKWILDKLTTVWAKIAKQGAKFIQEFLTVSKKELIKQGIKGLIDFVKENGTDLLT